MVSLSGNLCVLSSGSADMALESKPLQEQEEISYRSSSDLLDSEAEGNRDLQEEKQELQFEDPAEISLVQTSSEDKRTNGLYDSSALRKDYLLSLVLKIEEDFRCLKAYFDSVLLNLRSEILGRLGKACSDAFRKRRRSDATISTKHESKYLEMQVLGKSQRITRRLRKRIRLFVRPILNNSVS